MVLHPFLSRSKKEKERKKKKKNRRRKKGMLWVGFGSGPNSTWAFPIVNLYFFGLIAG